MVRKSVKLALTAVIAVSFAAMLAAFVVPRVRNLANQRIESAIASLQDTVHEATGLRLGYGYAMLSSSSRVSLREIEFFQETVDESWILRRKIADVGNLEIRIDLWAAIFGKTSDILKQIRIDDLNLDILLPDDRAVYEKISAYLAGRPSGELPRLTVDLYNTSLAVSDGENGRYSSSISSLQVSTISGSIEFVAPTMLFFISHSALGPEELFIQATMAKASIAADLSVAEASIGLFGRQGDFSIG
ncbi:MAG: hypothetical protein Q8O15_08820, partial [Rectinemataceae bacterium]|nr:hypothetical protein [Rectinemataceae bacterium]